MLTASMLKKRKGRITSSVAAAALGLHSRMSPLQAFLSIKGQYNLDQTRAMERGNDLEQMLLKEGVKKPAQWFGLKMRRAPFRVHKVHGKWAADSADAVYRNEDGEIVAIGEGKTAALGVAAEYGEEGTDEIPHSTLIQCHWHLEHWPETNICYVPVLVGGYKFEFQNYRVLRDPEFNGLMMDELAKWHRDFIVADKHPPAQRQDVELLERWNPRNMKGFIPATQEIKDLTLHRQFLKADIKALTNEADDTTARLKQIFGDGEGVSCDWGKVYYRNSKDGVTTDWQSLARSYNPTDEDIGEYTRATIGNRALRVYLSKDHKKAIDAQLSAKNEKADSE